MPPRRGGSRIKPPCYIELHNMTDLGRVACALQKFVHPVFLIQGRSEPLLTIQLDTFMGRPVIYFAKGKWNASPQFLAYRISGSGEEATIVDSAGNPGYVYAPIISVSKLPSLFEKGLRGGPLPKRNYLSVGITDLASLTKLCSFTMIYEEPPLPLFLFPWKDRWALGAFAHMDEYEDSSLFFYLLLDTEPKMNFVKYSTTRAHEASFTNNLEEHGYIFVKIIRLLKPHPLVDIKV